MINLNSKRFTLVSNSAGDAEPGQTIFTFEQTGRAVRATYEGGGVQLGALIGQIEQDDTLTVLFQQVTSAGKLCGGEGRMEVESSVDGKIRFVDLWKYTINGEGGGRAVWQEL